MRLLLLLSCALIVTSTLGFVFLLVIPFYPTAATVVLMIHGLVMIGASLVFLFGLCFVAIISLLGWGGIHSKIEFKFGD